MHTYVILYVYELVDFYIYFNAFSLQHDHNLPHTMSLWDTLYIGYYSPALLSGLHCSMNLDLQYYSIQIHSSFYAYISGASAKGRSLHIGHNCKKE